MMKTLFGRTLYEKRWFTAGWAVAFGVLSALVLMFYPSFSANGSFDEVAKSLPSQLQGFIGDPDVFKSIEGFIASQVYDVRMSLMIIIMTLVLAVSLTVREEESGDMRTTLMTSLSRNRLVAEKLLAAIVIVILLNLATTAGIYVGLLSLGESMPHTLIWQLFGLSCLFGLTAFSIPYSIGLATGRRAVVLSIGLVVAIGSYILTTFARSVEWLESWDYLSLIHYYDTASVRHGTFDRLDVAVLALIATVAVLIATLVFRSRDLN